MTRRMASSAPLTAAQHDRWAALVRAYGLNSDT